MILSKSDGIYSPKHSYASICHFNVDLLEDRIVFMYSTFVNAGLDRLSIGVAHGNYNHTRISFVTTKLVILVMSAQKTFDMSAIHRTNAVWQTFGLGEPCYCTPKICNISGKFDRIIELRKYVV